MKTVAKAFIDLQGSETSKYKRYLAIFSGGEANTNLK